MTSKTKKTAANDEATRSLVPKLRFPAFREDPGWTAETLEDALAMSATYGIVTAGEFQERGIPMLRGGDIKEGRIGDGLPFVTAEINSQYRRTILQANDVVISLVGYPGEAAVVPPRYVGANISRAVGLLRVKHALSAPFLACYLNSPAGKRTVLKPSAGSAQVVVNLKQLNALIIPTPSPAEQQKIAECLSSVDELIAAQARKLDALKTHKRGLMQQLFPSEGDTQPRLRFPEFQDAGEWVETTLGAACRMQAGKFVSASEIREANADDLFPCYGGNGLRGYTASFTHTGRYPLIGRQGALCGNVKLGLGQFHATEHAVVVTPKGGVAVDWLFYLLDYLRLNQYATGQAQPGLSVDVLDKVPVAISNQELEQQRIAACLTSLDDLIAAQTQKLAALKTHKKGLMQKLFPSPEELEA
jgi:type I restriction enzyme S subunit